MNKLLVTAAAGLAALTLNSCIIQQAVGLVVRDSYPGERPPMVIPDVNGKPANNNWRSIDEDVLPVPSFVRGKVSKAADGLPYGLTTEFSNIVVSPHAPNYNLDYTGIRPGTKVWDPYTRKPFYIPWSFTIN